MSLTNDEREEIIAAAVERALLALPEVVGNLMTNHYALTQINKKFYEAHPEFAAHKDVVMSVVEAVEGKNTIEDYDTILQKSVPEIKRRIAVASKLDMTTVNKPNRDFKDLTITSDNGEF